MNSHLQGRHNPNILRQMRLLCLLFSFLITLYQGGSLALPAQLLQPVDEVGWAQVKVGRYAPTK
jgi:hypothetical protein